MNFDNLDIVGYCETYFDTFESLCDNIAGDSPMHTMFRRDAEPVRCPFKGPFLFSYSKGGSGLNTCSYPKSYLDSCSDHHRLQLNFQACIDVQVKTKKIKIKNLILLIRRQHCSQLSIALFEFLSFMLKVLKSRISKFHFSGHKCLTSLSGHKSK